MPGMNLLHFCVSENILQVMQPRLSSVVVDVPVYTGDRELLATLTGYVLTRGVLCAMYRPVFRSVEEVLPECPTHCCY